MEQKQDQNTQQQQQQNQENKDQNQGKVSAAQRKQENNHKFQLNKRFGRFMDQMKQSQLKNKIVHNHLLLQKQQQPEVFSSDSKIKGLLIMHHGDGSENDYTVLREYLNKFGDNKVFVFPAFGYGYATFDKLENLQACLKSLETHMFDQIFKFKSGELSKQYYENPEEQYIIYYNTMNFINHLNQKHDRFVFFAPSVQELDFFETKCHNAIENATCSLQIPGLIMIHNFISEEEEKQLISEADSGEWSKLNKRQVQHYGHEFIYGPNKVNLDQSKVKPFPEQAQFTADRINEQFKKYGCEQDPLNQLTINSYEPGSGIPPHVDAHSPFEEYFAALSTGDGCVMSFKNIQDQEIHVFFPQRTLVIFSGEARYGWQHSIAARKVDKIDSEMHFRKRRISYTYRVVRKSLKCDCQWNYFCDSQGYNAEVMGKYKNNPLKPKGLNKKPEGNTVFARTEEEVKLMEKMQEDFEKNQKNHEEADLLKPSEVEKTYVYDVYEKIAPHFSSTRYKPWPKVTAFLDSIPQGALVADVGCGNGKYLSCKQNQEGEFFMIGTDRAQNFMEICREREKDCQVFSADSLKLPWRSGLFDAVISIAVIHHFSNDALRTQALSEIHRIMNDDGRALIYVWAMEQKEKDFQEQDIFVPWHNQFKFEEKAENMEKKKQNQGQEEEEKKQEQEVQQEQKNNDNQKKEGQEDPLTRQEQLEIEAKKHKQKAEAQQVSKVDAEKQSVVYKRYYHVFKEGELEELVKSTGLFDIEDHYFDHANWVVILRKKKQ